jgi:hypothetical protein
MRRTTYSSPKVTAFRKLSRVAIGDVAALPWARLDYNLNLL